MYIVGNKDKTKFVGVDVNGHYIITTNTPKLFTDRTEAWNVWNKLDNYGQDERWTLYIVNLTIDKETVE